MKILIVEDEQDLRETIRTSLLKEKFVVETAADYFSALDKIIIRPQFQTVHFIVQRILGGDDEHTVRTAQVLQLAQQIQTASSRQHNVQ